MKIICYYLFGSYYKDNLAKTNAKIEQNQASIQQIQKKVNENKKLADERQALISNLESNLSLIRLGITEIQSIEYPQDVDVEVMVEYFISCKIEL